jgi:hypothetical protein
MMEFHTADLETYFTVGESVVEKYVQVLWVVLACLVICRLLINFCKDLRFYWNNGWNFSEESGLSLFYGFSPPGAGRMSNKMRLFVGYPFLIFGFAALLLLTTDIWK